MVPRNGEQTLRTKKYITNPVRAADSRPERRSMKEMTGVCKFCGQTKLIQFEEGEDISSQALAFKADKIVTEQCDCRQAQRYSQETARRERIRNTIEAIFIEMPETADFVMAAAHAVMNGSITKATINIDEMTYTFYMKEEKLIFGRKRTYKSREEL